MSSPRVVLLGTVIAISLTTGIAAGASVELQGLRTAVHPDDTTILLRLGAPVRYTPTWVDGRTYALDIAGVSTTLAAQRQPVDSPLVGSYRIFRYQAADGKPHVRVELTLKSEAKVEVQQAKGGVTLRVRQNGASSSAAGSAPGGAPSSAPDQKQSPDTPAVPLNPKRGTAIRAVQVAKLEGTSILEVQIAGNGGLQYRTMRLSNPERLVVDIPDAANRIHQKQLSVNASPLRSVRIAQLSQRPPVARVVMDLESKTPFEVRAEANSLVVTLGSPGAPAPPAETKNYATGAAPELAADKLNGGKAAPARAKAPAAAPEKAAIDPPAKSFQRPELSETKQQQHSAAATTSSKSAISNQRSAISDQQPASSSPRPLAPGPTSAEATMSAPVHLAALSEPAKPAVAGVRNSEFGIRNSEFPVPPIPESRIPNPETAEARPKASGSLSAADSQPKREASAQRAGSAAVPAAPWAGGTPALLRRDSGSLMAQQPPPPAAAPESAQAPPPAKAYTGEPISVNLKDVDLKDFFRLIHEISGLNIVLDPTVTGTVTIVLDEVPWDQALDIVMRNNQLGREVEGNVVRIARLSTLEAEEKQRRDLAVAVEQAQPKTTVTRTLSYAKAADLIPTLKKFLTVRGDMVPDPRTNTIIITDIPGVIPTIDRLIHSLDQKSLQVEIEARVVAASRSFARDIGTQLAASGLTGNVLLGGTGNVGQSPLKRGTTPPLFIGTPPDPPKPGELPKFANVAQPLATNFPAAGATSGLILALTSGNLFALDAIITAAESRGIGKLLSRPKIITQNNVEATVKQGVKIPLQTTINNTISIQYVDVVLRLTVTPQITADGTIFLKTDIENTSIDPGIATTPGQFGLDTQSATTQVLVSNGGTVFFGGVVQNINRVNEQQVPLLGSVPLVGNLFKRKETTSTTNELLFFITPRIVQS